MSGKYKLQNVFIVCIPSNQIQLSILGFLIAMGKPIRADALAQSSMVGYPSFGIEPIKKHFLFVRGNITFLVASFAVAFSWTSGLVIMSFSLSACMLYFVMGI